MSELRREILRTTRWRRWWLAWFFLMCAFVFLASMSSVRGHGGFERWIAVYAGADGCSVEPISTPRSPLSWQEALSKAPEADAIFRFRARSNVSSWGSWSYRRGWGYFFEEYLTPDGESYYFNPHVPMPDAGFLSAEVHQKIVSFVEQYDIPTEARQIAWEPIDGATELENRWWSTRWTLTTRSFELGHFLLTLGIAASIAASIVTLVYAVAVSGKVIGREAGSCICCGYDVSSIPKSLVCPECGTRIVRS